VEDEEEAQRIHLPSESVNMMGLGTCVFIKGLCLKNPCCRGEPHVEPYIYIYIYLSIYIYIYTYIYIYIHIYIYIYLFIYIV
jgi:hypothetical protein